MNIKYIFFLSILFLAGCVIDEAPTPDVPPAVVTGAEKPVPIGELVTLTVAPYSFPSDIINVHYEWKVFDANGTKKVWLTENNQSVSFGTGSTAGKITAILDPTYVYGTSSKVVTDVKSAGISLIEVQVGDSPPTPDPIPVPPTPIPPVPPIPTPIVIPDGQFKLAKVVYDGLVVGKSTNKDFLSGLSNGYKTVAQQARAGAITNLKDAFAALKKSNQDSFSKNNEVATNWTALENSITTSVYQLYMDKKLPTLTDYAEVWTEIAGGFDIYISTLK